MSEKQFKCSFEGCNREFGKPSTLKWHTNIHLNERPFKCTFEDCDKSYSCPSHLKRHALNHKNLPKPKYQCENCTGFFSSSTNLKRHITRIHSDTAKFCEQCNTKFKKQDIYEEHMIKYHSLQTNLLQLYECEQCGKVLQTLKGFHRHKKRHLSVLFQCPVKDCLAQFYTLELLRDHKKSSHVSQYTCAYCDKIFYFKQYLKNHILTHMERRTFPCEYKNCNRIYCFKKNLVQHIQIFHRGQKFKCNLCNIKLSTKQKLDQHMSSQHKIKNNNLTVQYTCSNCNKKFYCKSALRNHVLSHLKKEERDKLLCPFNECNQFYFYKQTLNKHVKRHHKE